MSRPAYTVVFNDRPLRSAKTGVGHYLAELLTWLPQVAPQNRYVPFYFTWIARKPIPLARPASSTQGHEASGPPAGRLDVGRRHSWLVRRALQEAYQCLFDAVAKPARYDLYHEPNHIPMVWHGPTITTIHDLSVLRFPQWHPADRVAWYEHEFERGLRQSAHFIAVSQFTKREMVELTGMAPERITVIHEAPREVFRPIPAEQARPVLHRLRLKGTFFLFAGTIEPRKNLATVIAAYAQLPATLRQTHPLVIAGPTGWGDQAELARMARPLGDEIRFAGYLHDEELAALYSTCTALVWPSLYEGFGLPPLECMACGRPVIVGNVASLPEVVADAAVLVDPQDPSQVREAMRQIAEDPQTAEVLAHRGRQRARQFSWRRCAEQHVAVYDRFAP